MKSISIKQASAIIQKHISEFYAETDEAVNTNDWLLNLRIVPSEFEVFFPASKEFFKYRSLEWKLEWSIRDHLVIGIIVDLFRLAGIDGYLPVKKQNLGHPSFMYSNNKYGKEYPFAFILKTDAGQVGYRFSWFDDKNEKEIKKILREHKVNSYHIIDFRYYESIEKEKDVYSRRHDERVSLRSFFEEYFGIEIYNYYIFQTREAVARANEKNGYCVVPRLSLKHSSDFRITLMDSIAKINLNNFSYKTLRGNIIDINLLPQDDLRIVTTSFFDEGRYKSLCGNSDFAKCFLTAEYLFGVFEKGYSFDYTSVVCGYLKSVEQLLYNFFVSFFESSNEVLGYKDYKGGKKKIPNLREEKGADYIRENPYKPGKYQEKHEYKKGDNIELGGLVYFVRYEKRAWRVSEVGKEIICKCLDDYTQTCRNEHFHKDNIVEYHEVERIRNNTYICLALILGGFKMMNEPVSEKSLLGIRNYDYERFYNAVWSIPILASIFTFQMRDGSFVNGYRRRDKRIPRFEDGLVSNMEFIRLEDINLVYEVSSEDELEQKADGLIIINRDNLPVKAWYHYGNKYEIEW